jgi:hypothetical protein
MMSWNNIRLELACAREFPRGSPHRCYLLTLPLETSGLIDEELVLASPNRATVRRFWPSQADLRGNVIKTADGWAFSYESGEEADERVFDFDTHPIRVGECFTVTEPDRERLPFRVTNVVPFP